MSVPQLITAFTYVFRSFSNCSVECQSSDEMYCLSTVFFFVFHAHSLSLFVYLLWFSFHGLPFSSFSSFFSSPSLFVCVSSLVLCPWSSVSTLYRTRPFTEFWVVSIEHLRRVWHADRGRLLLRTPGPVPLGLAYVLLVETNPFPNLSLFYRTMLFEYPSVLSRFSFHHPESVYKVGRRTDQDVFRYPVRK